ncbi:unnamed protein product, partial [Amoebophrya sp. A25]
CVVDSQALKAFLDEVAGSAGQWKAEAVLGATWERAMPILSTDGTHLGRVFVSLFYQKKQRIFGDKGNGEADPPVTLAVP